MSEILGASGGTTSGDGEKAMTQVQIDKLAIQEMIVSNFASLLGSKNKDNELKSATEKEFEECLSNTVNGTDIICSLPGLDLKTSMKDEETARKALPKVGEHSRKTAAGNKVPAMAASVLNSAGAAEASAEASDLEQRASQSLHTLTMWTKSTLVYAPSAISKNISASFNSLVNSRIRAWTLLLLRHSLTTGENASRSRLLNMLSSKIELKSVSTTFKTLSLPEAARLQPKEADVILPLLLEAVLEVSLKGKTDVVPLTAPGTISGNFASGSAAGLVKVDVRLDTGAFLESMVEQARLVVFKVVARATKVEVDRKKTGGASTSNEAPASSLSGFGSSLNLSSTNLTSDSPRLKKARASALRLNSILQSNAAMKNSSGNGSSNRLDVQGTPLSKTRKMRSVQWEHPLALPSKDASNFPDPKRQRVLQSTSRLRSYKSFGRPHGGGSESSGPKNATFGDFGRTGGPTWDRHGRLLNHPKPGGGGVGLSSRMSSLETGTGEESSRNAIFDLPGSGGGAVKKPRMASASALAGASLLGHTRAGSVRSLSRGSSFSRGVPSTIPRTATALESWLMNKATKN
eukprot:CAMPEP_0194048794 /NCGR_PEP_ID=MMETSP0009_2-20130614/28566_1 /TAXON_ID=210454 /ORGANISM="Grammatophora oceanica, Strain CCMP 410" /LENGTH=575 /DNA_ID=CAMNT_0038694779 /DNA_START=79 /DNA_END=1806 /DNA_ORIENTATION=-